MGDGSGPLNRAGIVGILDERITVEAPPDATVADLIR